MGRGVAGLRPLDEAARAVGSTHAAGRVAAPGHAGRSGPSRRGRRLALALAAFVTLGALPLHASADPAVSKEFLAPASVNAGNWQSTTGQVTDNTPGQGDVRTVRLGISQVGNAISAGQITDNLPAQIRLANPVNARVSSGCGATPAFSGAAGGGTFTAGALDVPAGVNANPGRCFVYFDVVSTVVGNWINQIDVGGFTGTEAGVGAVANAQAAPRNLTVTALAAIGVGKAFSPSTVFMGGTSTLTITLSNPNGTSSIDLSALAENLPANVQATTATPSIACSAGGTAGSVSAGGTTGNTTLTFSGTRIAGGGTCTITWPMRGLVQNGTSLSGTNTIPADAVSNNRGVGSQAATAPFTTLSPVTLAKTFFPDPARAGEPITLSISVTNRSAAAVTAVGWTDPLPGDMVVNQAPTANAACQGATVTGAVGSNTITLAGATVAAGATCIVTARVVAGSVLTYNNITSGASWTQAGVGSAVTDPAITPVTVFSGVRAYKLLLDRNGIAINGPLAAGDVARFRMELENYADGQVTGVTLTDALPSAGGAQIVYATANTPGAANPRTNCTPSADPTQPGPVGTPATAQTDGAATITFTGLVLPGNPNSNPLAGNRCFIEWDVLVPRNWPAGTTINNAVAPANVTGATLQNTASSSTPTTAQYVIAKSFAPSTISAGDTAQVTLTLVNTGFFPLTNITLDDPLPAPTVNGITAQLRIPTPANTATTCSGTPSFSISAARDRLIVSGLTVPARASGALDSRCTVSFTVQAPIPVAYDNVATSVTATDGRTGTVIPAPPPATATLVATPSLTATKSFAPAPVAATGGVSRVTITLGNIGTAQLTGVGVNDPLPAQLRIATPPNAASTCAGAPTLTATAGAASAALAGARLPAGTTCTFQFDVVTNAAPNPVTNTIPPAGVFADGGVVTTTPVTANLATFGGGSINVQKSFSLTDLQTLGQPTRLTLTLANVSTQAVTGLSITDNLPAGMVVTSAPNAVTSCPGGVLQAAPLGGQITLTGASLPAGTGAFPAPANATCTVQVDVTLRRTGTVANAIPPNSVVTDQALTNLTQAVANVTALATVGVSKRFDPTAVAPNAPSRLTITVINGQATAFTNLQVVDPLPAGITVANPANATTSCGAGAVVSTRPSTQGGGRTDVVLSGGTLAGGGNPSTCDIAINVTGAAVGTYDNVIPAGGVTADGGVTNQAPASATLNVRTAVTVAKAFANFNRRVNEPNRLTITIGNPNAAPLTNATLTDDYPVNVFNTTAPNATTTCGGVVTAPASGTFVRLTGGTVPANGSCTVQVDVLANEAGTWTNTIPDSALRTAEGVTNAAPASATFVTLDPPVLGKEFLPVQIASGGVSKLRIVLGNANGVALALTAALEDTLRAGLSFAAPALDTTTADTQGKPRCAGVTTAGTTLTVANGSSIPAGGCAIWANVTGTVAGEYLNVIPAGALSTSGGQNALPATATLAISAQNSITGRVYRDHDNNGAFGGSDSGIAGQPIELLDAGGAVIATTVTDAIGNYAFLQLGNGTYSVREPNQPAGTLNGITTGGTGAATNGTPTPVTTLPSRVTGIVLAGAQNAQNVDFGEVVAASLAGNVFRDDNNNGTRQGTEPPLAGVTITLTGTNDLGQAVSVTTTTDAAGSYTFTGLRPGTYTLAEPTQPAGTVNGITTAGTGATTNGTASSVVTLPSTIGGIVLAPNQAGTGFNFAEIPPVSLGGTVFFDTNNNGVQNAGETGIPGQRILVTGNDDLGRPVSVTLTTDANGNFAATDLRPGTYTLTQLAQPAGTSNGITTAGPAGGTATPVGTLPSAITAIPLTTPGASAPGNTFAEVTSGASSISGRVWRDANNNGVIDAGETFFAGVTIELTGTDGGGNAISRTAVTDATGNYAFPNVPPGTYTLREPTQPPTTVNGITVAGSTGGTASAVGTTPSTITNLVLGANVASVNNNFGELPEAVVSGFVYNDRNNNGQRDAAAGEGGFATQTITLTGTNDLGQPVALTTDTAADGGYAFTGLRPGTYTVTQPNQPASTVPGRTTAGSLGGTASAVGTLPSTISGIVVPAGGQGVDNNFGEIGNSSDVVVTKEALGTFATSNVGTYRITAANAGQIATSGAYTVTDRLPAGMSLAATPAGTGWTCNGAAGATTFTCTASTVIAAGTANTNTIAVSVAVAANATNGANQIVLDNAVLIEGGGELDAYAPTTNERTLFTTNPGALPVCSTPPAVNFNVCRTPTTVLLAAAASGTVWYDTGSASRQLDGGDRRLAGWIVEVIDTTVTSGAPIVRRITTAADGTWRADGLVPNREYLVRFRDPQAGILWGPPVSGETGVAPAPCVPNNVGAARSSCVETGGATQLRITLAPGDLLPQQSLPVVPGGVIYDAITRAPVPGSTVTLSPGGSCPGFDPATQVVNAQLGGFAVSGSSVSMTVGALGAYQFLFAPTAPASCQFRLDVTPPGTHRFPSELLPPQAGALVPPAVPGTTFVQPQPTAPAQGQPTPWFRFIGGGSGLQPIVNHHIPLDQATLAGLTIVKVGSVREVELGDSLQYTIRIRNALAADRPALYVQDHLPAGFRYIPGTSTVTRNGATAPLADPAGGVGPNLVFNVGVIGANSDVLLSYRVRVGVGAAQGDGINRARARPDPGTNCATTPAACSNETQWKVKVTLGVFTTDACFAGKIFVDCNHNHVQDREELGIPGVRLWLQDGRSVISDSEGKYSLCGLPPKLHVLKVDPLTLPRGARLTTSSNRNAGDANSLFLDLKNGELHRADFIEGSCSNTVLEQVKSRRTQGEVTAPQTERRGGTPLRFKGKAPAYPQQGTDGANQQPAVRPRPDAPRKPGPSENENDTPTWQLPLNQPPSSPEKQPGGTDAK